MGDFCGDINGLQFSDKCGAGGAASSSDAGTAIDTDKGTAIKARGLRILSATRSNCLAKTRVGATTGRGIAASAGLSSLNIATSRVAFGIKPTGGSTSKAAGRVGMKGSDAVDSIMGRLGSTKLGTGFSTKGEHFCLDSSSSKCTASFGVATSDDSAGSAALLGTLNLNGATGGVSKDSTIVILGNMGCADAAGGFSVGKLSVSIGKIASGISSLRGISISTLSSDGTISVSAAASARKVCSGVGSFLADCGGVVGGVAGLCGTSSTGGCRPLASSRGSRVSSSRMRG